MNDMTHVWDLFMGGFLLLAKVSAVGLAVVVVGAFIYDAWTDKHD
jgi:hypothetical protein